MKTKETLTGYREKLKLVAVIKGKSPEEVRKMIKKTGVKRIGENRIQEAEGKFQELPGNLEKHFIGKLQSRKIPKIVQLFDVIQSVETLDQAKKISKQGKTIGIFLQINISNLPQRSGCKPEEAKKQIEEIQRLPNIKLLGVMGIASPNPQKARQEFKLLKSLQGDLPECSMGMSSDYKIAIEEGSTMLRLGRILFEEPLPKLPNFE